MFHFIIGLVMGAVLVGTAVAFTLPKILAEIRSVRTDVAHSLSSVETKVGGTSLPLVGKK